MALSLEQLEARRAYIGSSDVPALLGVDKYRNIGDLYAEKAGLTELFVTSSAAADWGDRLEPIVCEWVGERLGHAVKRGEYRQSEDGVLRCQLDGWVAPLGEAVEIKTSGLLNPMFRAEEEGWGADGSDEVPFRVVAQVQFALMLSGAPRCHVGAFLGGGVGPRHYVIEAHAALQAEIKRRCYAFWREHVLTRTPPEAVPSLDTLKIVRREPAKSVEVPAELIARYADVKNQAAMVKVAEDEAKAALLHALGDAEEAYSPFGTVTYMANKRGVRTLRLKETA